MSKTCLVCSAPHSERISILRHPEALDSKLKFLLGLQASRGDYLCQRCCNEVTNAFNLKQKYLQCNQSGPELFRSDWAVIKNEVDPDDQIENAVSAKDPVVKIEPESGDVEGVLKMNDESTHVSSNERLKPDFDLKLEPKLEPSADNEYKPVEQKSIWATAGGESDSIKLEGTERSWSVSEEYFNIVTLDTACEQNGSLSSEDCLKYFKREKSVDIDDSTDDNISNERKDSEVKDLKAVNSLESKKVPVSDRQHNPIIYCEVCSKSYLQIGRYQSHFKQEHPDIAIKNPSLLENPCKCSYCTKTFNHNFEHQIHGGTTTKVRPYVCNECGKGFTTTSHLKIHERIHAGFNIVPSDTACKPSGSDDCLQYFKKENSADIEDSTDEKEDKVKDMKAIDSLRSKEGPVSDRQHNPIIYCEVCSKSYLQIGRYKSHFKREHPDIAIKKPSLLKDPCKCSYCTKTFQHSNEHQIHGGTSMKVRPYVCAECGKGFTTNNHLKIHERIHTGEKPYKCSHCPKSFATSDRLRNHERTHTNEKPYVCSQCGKHFSTTCILKVHQRIHTGEKPYKCSECGKSFITSYILKNHEMIHTGEKPYECSYCSKTFARTDRHQAHVRTHTNEKPYVCSQCGKCFSTTWVLKIHQRVHTGEKPYKCSECGKNFTTSSKLKDHEKIHTGEKPYQCSYCSKTFARTDQHRAHLRTHTNEKPYVCSECGKCFSTNCVLKIHQRIHTGEKPYKCSECGKGFITSSKLKDHESMHTGEKLQSAPSALKLPLTGIT